MIYIRFFLWRCCFNENEFVWLQALQLWWFAVYCKILLCFKEIIWIYFSSERFYITNGYCLLVWASFRPVPMRFWMVFDQLSTSFRPVFDQFSTNFQLYFGQFYTSFRTVFNHGKTFIKINSNRFRTVLGQLSP